MPRDPETGKRKRGRPSKKELMEEQSSNVVIDEALRLAAEEHSVQLPNGKMIACYTEEEKQAVELDMAPYVLRRDRIPDDYWPILSMYLEMLLQWRRLGPPIDRLQKSEHVDHEALDSMLRRRERLFAQISETARRLDPLKQEESEGTNAAEIFAEYMRGAVEYMEERPGEFEWQCPQCGGFNMCEVPHWAFDTSAGPRVIWNTPLMERVRYYYEWRHRWETAVKQLPDAVRKAIQGSQIVQRLVEEAGGISLLEAAEILGTSAIGLLATAQIDRERFNLGFEYDIDKPSTFASYVQTPEEYAEWVVSHSNPRSTVSQP